MRRRNRDGATAVEFALVLPVFLFLVFGIMLYGHMRMVDNLVVGACRDAARYGATDGVTTQQALARAQQIAATGISLAHVQFVVKNAGTLDSGGTIPTTEEGIAALPDIELANADPRQLFLIRATVDYSNVAIIPLPWVNQTLVGQSITRHE